MKLVALATLVAAFGSSVLAASGGSTQGLQSTECVAAGDASKNLYATKSEVKYAKLFTIEYHDSYKVVNDLAANGTYVLYQCGSERPSVKNADAYIPIPVKSVAAWSTSAAAFIEALGVQDHVQNLGTSPSITSACLQELLAEVIKPFDEGNSTSVDVQEQNNTVVFNMPGGEDANATNTAFSSEYLETSALGRSEWIKFFGAFFNAEERANKLFDEISSNYECFTHKANSEFNKLRPVVAWTSYAAPSSFNNNTAYWQISVAGYKYDLVRDAGARMLNTTSRTQSTMFSSAAAFLDALEDVDIVIDESFVSYTYSELLKNYGISGSNKAKYPWAAAGRVFRPDRIQSTAGGLDWFESPVVFADALLQDVIGVAHPKFAKSAYSPIWFRNLSKDEPVAVVTASNCTDMYAARKDPAATCSSIDFQSANPTDSAYSGVDVSQTQDLIYDISKSEIISGAAALRAAVVATLGGAGAALAALYVL
ncbi:hypothetical protein LPJ61_001241 [Coemansia biformis]|uniref:Periplasmic binding protein-like II n=1 Tax=Coemansia biformis TaxID=1286918 RepID=A0A9W7YAC8_9FUNG|nr:hypothetical protein LPJ61_001241 [Coemansia biformis]